MHDAKDREDVMKHVAELKNENEWLQKEAVATLQGQDAIDAFNVAKSVQTELIGKKIAVGSEEYNQLVAATEAQLKITKQWSRPTTQKVSLIACTRRQSCSRITPKSKKLSTLQWRFTQKSRALSGRFAKARQRV